MSKIKRQLSNKTLAFDLYIPVAIESARSARVAYIAFLVLGFTLVITLLQVDHIGLLLSKPIVLPVINREVPISLYLIAGPILLLLAYLGVMLRIVTVRRVVTACLFDSDGQIRPLRLRRRVKNTLPSFDPAIAFSSLPIGQMERGIRIAVTIATLVLLPFLAVLYFYFIALIHNAALPILLQRIILAMIPLVGFWGLAWPTTTRRTTGRNSRLIGLVLTGSFSILILVATQFVFKPQSQYELWNQWEKAYWSDPRVRTMSSIDGGWLVPTESTQFLHDSKFGWHGAGRRYKTIFNVIKSRSITTPFSPKQTIVNEGSNNLPATLEMKLLGKLILRKAYLAQRQKRPTVGRRYIAYPDLSKLIADGIRFEGTLLRGPLFSKSSLIASQWYGATLAEPVFTETIMPFAEFNSSSIVGGMMYGVDCRRSNWIEGRIVLTHMSNVLCQGSDFSKMFLQGVDVPHSFPVRMDGSMIDNSLVIGSSIGLNGEFSATNVTFILSAIVPTPEPPAVTFNKENYRDLWEDDIKARSPEKKQNVMLYSSLEGYHAAPEDFTEQLTGYKFALCKNQGLIHGFRRECQGYALDHSSAYGMDKKDKMINAHKRGLIPGIMATTYNARLPNLLISCQLALFAKELSVW